ncbi:MAG: GtrA family protein [Lachnospiraceae bacterium]|nr:GtrA family protein [Lachnospiraceae bacterium]
MKTPCDTQKPKRKNLEERFENWLNRWPKIHELYVKYEEIITYLVVGGMTTVVAWTCKFLANLILYRGAVEHNSFETGVLTFIDWTAGVIFAFFTNRAYVFKSDAPMLPEAGKFVLSRISTLFLEFLCMLILDTLMHVNFYVATIVTAVIVVIANYIFSKLIVFRKKPE